MHYIFAVPFVVHLLMTGSLFVPSLWLSDILSLLAQLAFMWGFIAFWKWRLLSATSYLYNILFNICLITLYASIHFDVSWERFPFNLTFDLMLVY